MSSFKDTAAEPPTPPSNNYETRLQAPLWVLSSTTGIITTRLLLGSSQPAIADALLLIHVTLAMVLYIYNHGLRMFLHVPAVSVQEWRFSIGLRPRPIRCIWVDWFCRVLYVVLTTVSLRYGIRAIAELQNLPVTMLLMQIGTLPRDLFMACLGLMWARSMCRSNWGELRLQSAWLVYQVVSVIGLGWLCWIYSRDHLAGVLSAVASSMSSAMATVLHQWIADDIRIHGMDKRGTHAFDAVVIALNAVALASTSHLRANTIVGLLNFCNASGLLSILNVLSGALAIYTAGGVIRRLRTTIDMLWFSWTNICVAVVWHVVLIVCEISAIGSCKSSPLEVMTYVVFMAGRQPIEELYQAFGLVGAWVGERRARSVT